MAQMSEIAEGLEILLIFGDGSFDAAHEEVFAGHGTPPRVLSDAHKKRMADLRWSWLQEHHCWHHFT